MVEIVLALAVVAIGVLSIVSLVPIGSQAARDAIGESYASQTAEHLLNWIATDAKSNWDAYTDPSTYDGKIPSAGSSLATVSTMNAGDWDERVSITDQNSTGLWEHKTVPAVFHVQQTTRISVTERIVEMDAVVRVWRTPTQAPEWNVTSWVNTSDSNFLRRMQLNMEVTWPATIPYNRRQKAYYTLEVARQ